MDKLPGEEIHSAASKASSALFAENLRALKARFPEAASSIADDKPLRESEITATPQGCVIIHKGQCLDHPTKPLEAAKIWAQRLMGDPRFSSARNIAIYGLGSGYHIEALRKLYTGNIIVIEPSLEVIKAACSCRNLEGVLTAMSSLLIESSDLYSDLPEDIELVIRPQSQVTTPQHCAKTKAAIYGKKGFTSLNPRIGILGPLQGGTLPITGYCDRAFGALKFRKQTFDMSGFAHGFHEIKNFVFEGPARDVIEGNYIEMLSNMLLKSIEQYPVDILICMAQAPISGQALELLRKGGVTTVLWFVEDYLRFTYWREIARYYDFIFTIQKGECIEAIKAAGAGEVHYLPLACDPEVHAPMNLTEEEQQRWGSPVSFVGAGYHNRQQVFASLAGLPFKIWGTQWPHCKPFTFLVQENGRRLTPAEYVKIFNATDVNLNLHSSSERDEVDPFGDFVNPRTFELAACGAFQLVDQRSLLSELFTPGEEVVTFRDRNELKEKISYYLEHREEREAIARRARARALSEHTYEKRLKEMMRIIYSSKFESLYRREASSPWSRLLNSSKKHRELHSMCKKAFDAGKPPFLDSLVDQIVTGNGEMTDTERKLMFLHHIKDQMIVMKRDRGDT
ncbi:MAG: hypothetical protein D6808_01485 [Candidatus Dadabacteria bacterium]|nr:MAG: hypothetical protein D6808_01485 [Candidatus Dadabacteria bacterium]